jgi:hypothetical protein
MFNIRGIGLSPNKQQIIQQETTMRSNESQKLINQKKNIPPIHTPTETMVVDVGDEIAYWKLSI